jgi:DNA repair protein RadC
MEQQINIEALNQVSEIELAYKSKVKASERPLVKYSEDAYKIFIKFWDKNKIELVEQFNAMFMNRGNKVLAIYQLSTGGITGTIADPRLLFIAALKVGAVSMILAHNHVSSNKTLSSADRELTQKIKEGGKLLEIKLLDHLIITASEGFYSMADAGLI